MIRKINLPRFPLLLLSLACSIEASAGDDAVNCRTEVKYRDVYSGIARCGVYVGGTQVYQILERYVPPTTLPVITLTELYEGPRGTYYLSCTASVPYSHKQEIIENVCDYTPQASINHYVAHDGTAATATLRLRSNASDRDGSIVKTEWWINGRYYGTSVPNFTVNKFTKFSIKQKVIDNDGYTDETTKVVHVDPGDDPCLRGVTSC